MALKGRVEGKTLRGPVMPGVGSGCTAPYTRHHAALAALLSPVARPLRSACTGGIAALLQLGLLDTLVHGRVTPLLANAAALVVSTQINFILSYLFTWYDRRPPQRVSRVVLRWWATYQGSSAGTAALNLLVFAVARAGLPLLAAAALGSGVAAIGNFVLNDRFVFRRDV